VTVAVAVTDRSLEPAGVDQYSAFEDWVRSHARPDAVLLDVGAGDGDQPYPTNLAPSVARIVGVDPDQGILGNERIDEGHHATLEDFARDHPGEHDLAVAVYVVEHVPDPLAFTTALHRCLKPGGSAFLITPNRWHYFGALALGAQRLHLDEWLLHRLRDETHLHEHHFPIQYRMNSARAISRIAERVGFHTVEVRMVDEPGIYQPYFPTRLKSLPERYSELIHRRGWPGLAGTILARLER
jgi:2-polyprenyl-3-methyl-5-hydroxy-6-metoxy-1,4-benzoquinol methylase